ncbi:hypothetical protein C8J57DRAFT_1228351 [Mycena rebaudengoi]|nr:hypothetical protein C8J57DRAFT_1228351 [Mycena rebaudengoi]
MASAIGHTLPGFEFAPFNFRYTGHELAISSFGDSTSLIRSSSAVSYSFFVLQEPPTRIEVTVTHDKTGRGPDRPRDRQAGAPVWGTNEGGWSEKRSRKRKEKGWNEDRRRKRGQASINAKARAGCHEIAERENGAKDGARRAAVGRTNNQAGALGWSEEWSTRMDRGARRKTQSAANQRETAARLPRGRTGAGGEGGRSAKSEERKGPRKKEGTEDGAGVAGKNAGRRPVDVVRKSAAGSAPERRKEGVKGLLYCGSGKLAIDDDGGEAWAKDEAPGAGRLGASVGESGEPKNFTWTGGSKKKKETKRQNGPGPSRTGGICGRCGQRGQWVQMRATGYQDFHSLPWLWNGEIWSEWTCISSINIEHGASLEVILRL